METILQWLLLAAAVGIGWMLGRWGILEDRQRKPTFSDELALRERLQFLFTSYSDEAIESFVDTLAVNKDTINLHLSIGAHFRDKGEIEKATLIHQNLLARPELPTQFTSRVTYELAQDYMSAGLLDRAESLFHQLLGSRSFGEEAARELIELYKREQEWAKARMVAEKLVAIDNRPEYRKQLAYILCEQAAIVQRTDQRFEARGILREALNVDPGCVRASLLLAELYHQDQHDKDARNELLRVFEQKPVYGPEAVRLLVRFARERGKEDRLGKTLNKLYREHPSATLLLAMVDVERQTAGPEVAERLLRAELERKPSLRGLLRLQELGEVRTGKESEADRLVRKVGEQVLRDRPTYRCVRCGFSGRQMHWMCPGCKSWESVEPTRGVDGE